MEGMCQGLRQLVYDLKGDPQALEAVWMSVITFAGDAVQVVRGHRLMAARRPVLGYRWCD